MNDAVYYQDDPDLIQDLIDRFDRAITLDEFATIYAHYLNASDDKFSPSVRGMLDNHHIRPAFDRLTGEQYARIT